MSLTCQLGCPPARCERRAATSAGGWRCIWLAGLGVLDSPARASDAPPASHGSASAAEPPRTGERAGLVARAAGTPACDSPSCASPAQATKVATIEAGRCPCCGGGLGGSDRPTWRRCVACRCYWAITVSGGLAYSETVTNPRCSPARPAAGMAARRTA